MLIENVSKMQPIEVVLTLIIIGMAGFVLIGIIDHIWKQIKRGKK